MDVSTTSVSWRPMQPSAESIARSCIVVTTRPHAHTVICVPHPLDRSIGLQSSSDCPHHLSLRSSAALIDPLGV